MLQGVSRDTKKSPASKERKQQCYRRPTAPLPPAPVPISSHRQAQPPTTIHARRRSDGKPVYLSSSSISRGAPSVPTPFPSVMTRHVSNPMDPLRLPPPPAFLSSPPRRGMYAAAAKYGWCKNVFMLIFGIIILFVVFAAVIAIFPSDDKSTLELHEDNGGDDDDDDDENGEGEREDRSSSNPLTPFPKQTADGTCPPGFRPYFSGCILNMPYPRAVDDTIKDPDVSPCVSLNAYACGGWRKYDRDRGARSFRTSSRWNKRLAEYVRKVNGLRETFSWDAATKTPENDGGGDEEEEILFHLLTRSCVRSLEAESPMVASTKLTSLLDKLQAAADGDMIHRRAVGVMVATLTSHGMPSVVHVEPMRNPRDRSQSVLYMEPWATIGSDPHYVRKWFVQGGSNSDDERLRAHMELVEKACAALATLKRISRSQISECATSALSIEAALIGSVQKIPETGNGYFSSSSTFSQDLVPDGERSMAEAVDANDYRSGFADGFYDTLTEEMDLSNAASSAVRKFSIWTLGGLEPFFESGLGVLLDTEQDSRKWLYYFQVAVMSEASHYLPNPHYNGGERVKALLADLGSHGSPEALLTRRDERLLPWGRLRRTEHLRGHVRDNALGYTASAAADSSTNRKRTGAEGWITPYENAQDPMIEQSEVWRSCLSAAAVYLPEVADDTFSDLVVTEEDRAIVERVSSNILRALLESVSSSDRLSGDAKRRIASKARSIIQRIARPWKDRPPVHEGLELYGKNFFDDAVSVRAWNTRETFFAALVYVISDRGGGGGVREGDAGKSGDGDNNHHTPDAHAETKDKISSMPFQDPRFGRAGTRRFAMPADWSNAFYSPTENILTILSGIMTPPFFDRRYSNASLCATIGAVIGHEFYHAFDAEGVQFDRYGNVAPGWLPKGDREAYEEAKECYVRQYDGRKTVNGNVDDGTLTVSENLADSMGLRAAWMALTKGRRDEVRSEEAAEFLEAYAQLWCSSVPADREHSQMATNPHSPGSIRADGAVQNLRDPDTDFSPMEIAYGCKRGKEPMVPEKICKLW